MRKIAAALVVLALVFACSSSDGGGQSASYDRKVVLTNWADNNIIPAYDDYQTKVNALSAATATFNANPSASTISALRDAWANAYKVWQYAGMFEIGKAEAVSLKAATNTYPANVAGIESNIAAGTYNLSLFGQFDKQGFPALDYLLYGVGADDTAIVAKYTTDANAAKYRQYLTDVVARLKTNADAVATDWHNGYRDTYVNNSGTGVSSSFSKTTNLFVKYLERDIRSGKIGIPAGTLSNGVTYPEKIEVRFNKTLAPVLFAEAVTATKNFFEGRGYGSNTAAGAGYVSILQEIHADRDGQNLSAVIENQYATLNSARTTYLQADLGNQISTDNANVLKVYTELQQLVVYAKLDMMQALNVTVDYVDGDGD